MLGILLFTLGLQVQAQGVQVANCENIKKFKSQGSVEKTLNQFMANHWAYQMREYPNWATYVGYPGMNDRWPDMSLEAVDQRKKDRVCQKQYLQTLAFQKLSGESRLNYDLLLYNISLDIEGDQFPTELMAMSQMSGLQTDVPDVLSAAPQRRTQDYQDRLKRLETLPTYVHQIKTLMAKGASQGVVPPKLVIEKVVAQLEGVMVTDMAKSPLYLPFVEIPSQIPESEKKVLQTKAQELIAKVAIPSLGELKTFLVKDYLPKCRDSIAWTELPQGQKWYAYLVKRHTTTQMTPQQIHDLGMSEIKRLTSEMEKLRETVGFKGDQKAFNKFLRTDKQFFFNNGRELVAAYRDIGKRIDPELPRLFSKLPRLPYGIREMPSFKAPSSPTAYYMQGSPKAGTAGYFDANTYDLSARPRWEMEVLTAHEAVPGHHLQIALAQEMEEMPDFRRESYYTAFTEGWGLYAESLGSDLGLYKDPYSKYGQMSYDLWRAIRLVVDTGMHSLGWSREKALKFSSEYLPKPEAQVATEIDRYIADPGQALAYKIGQLKLFELRKKFQNKRGEKYDIRDFHNEVLKHGALPMDVLEKVVDREEPQKK